MRILCSLVLAAGLLVSAAAWADPVPADKMAYVGNWKMTVDGVELTREP